MKAGTRVRIVTDALGVIDETQPWRFAERIVRTGETAIVSGIPYGAGEQGWFYVEMEDDRTAVVPVTDQMVEAIQ